MRIAIYHNLPSGGAKRTLFEQVKRLAPDHVVDVYTLSSANHEFADIRPFATNHWVFDFQPFRLLNSPFGRLNPIIRLLDFSRLKTLSRRVASSINSIGYDVLFVHPCQFESCPTILRYAECNPSVYYCHESPRILYETMPERPYVLAHTKRRQVMDKIDPLPRVYRSKFMKNDQTNIRSASKVIVNSKFTQNEISRIYKLKTEVSYHGVDTHYFRKTDVKKENMVLSVGSLTPLKGFDFIIQSIASLPENQRPVLVIASNFQNLEERQYLENLGMFKNVNVKLVGNVSDDHLLQLYNRAKMTVYAPIREPFGLVPLESMACGTPVVAVREGGVPETMISGYTGYLVDRDPKDFAEAVLNLLSDGTQAEKFGQAAREHVVQNWTWDRAIETLKRHMTIV